MLKTRGNDRFKEKAYIKAATEFGNAIKKYELKGMPRSMELDTLIAACYTNRALMFHFMGDQDRALEDASFVLEKLDPKN